MEEEKITKAQFDSLWKWCGMVAEVLREDGQTLNEYITLPIRPTKESIKLLLVKPIMEKSFGKTSSRELNKQKEIDEIVDTLIQAFAAYGISLPPFPSADSKNFNETYQ